MEYLSDGVPVYSEHDASMVEQARFMMQSDSYYSPLTAMRIGNGGVWYYPLCDSLGSTRRLINASQSVTDAYSYDAFGNITAQSGTTYNPYRYVGSLGYYSADYSTGLLHLGARYYNSLHGRFTTPDPMRSEVNWYRYVSNRPTASVDPSGLYWWLLPGAIYGSRTACVAGVLAGAGDMPGTMHDKFRHCATSCLLAGLCGVHYQDCMLIGYGKEFKDEFCQRFPLLCLGREGTGFDATDIEADRFGCRAGGLVREVQVPDCQAQEEPWERCQKICEHRYGAYSE